MMMREKTPEHNQTQHPKNHKTKNTTKQKTQPGHNQHPIKLVVFPLYGSETGEKSSCILSKGLNSPRKCQMHLSVGEISERPIKCDLFLLSR